MTVQKRCSKCKTVKSVSAVHNRYNGVQCWCRECARNYRIQRKPETAIAPKSHSYVMSYEGISPGIYKVGQSANVDHRVQTLDQSYILRIVVIAVFWDRGDLESHVHDLLSAYRDKRLSNSGVVQLSSRHRPWCRSCGSCAAAPPGRRPPALDKDVRFIFRPRV